MDVVARGDSVAFFAGPLLGSYTDASCSEDLHCTLHKNHTRAVQVSPGGIRLLQLNPDHAGRFISTEEIEPTPTLATLYTGNPVVDQTPALAWINSTTIKLLATTVETVNFLSTATSSTDDDLTLINPSPTESVKLWTTIAGELDGLKRRLMSSATVPVPTPVQTHYDDPELENDDIYLETNTDILTIRPGPSKLYGSNNKSATFSFTAKKAGTSTEAQSGGTTSVPVETGVPETTGSISSFATSSATAIATGQAKSVRTGAEKKRWLEEKPTTSHEVKRQKLDIGLDLSSTSETESEESDREIFLRIKRKKIEEGYFAHELELKSRLSEKEKQRLESTGAGIRIAPVIVPIKFGNISYKCALEKKLITEQEWRRVRDVTKKNTLRVRDFDEWLRIRKEGTAEEQRKLNEEEKQHDLREEKRVMLARKDRILHGQRVVVSGARPYLEAAGLNLDDLPKTLDEFKDPVEPDEDAGEAAWKEYDRALLIKKFFGRATELIGTRADLGWSKRGGYLLADGIYYEFTND